MDRVRPEDRACMSKDITLPADLIEHAQFVRRLAAQLLHDDSAADDAAQETLVRALRRPPRAGPGLHGWFGAVLRNVIRMDHRGSVRRARRERVAARPEGVRGAADAASRAEILERVAAALRALPPRDLEVVLLRHYEGLPPRAIAKRLHLDVDVVKRRLQGGHARLRSMLDEGRGGNVEDWRTSLAVVVGLPGSAGSPAGPPAAPSAAATAAALAGAKAPFLVAVFLTVGGGLLILLRSPPGRDDDVGTGRTTHADAPTPGSGPGVGPPPGLARPPARREALAAADAPAAAAKPLGVSGKVADPGGKPVAKASLRLRLARGDAVEETVVVQSANDGAYAAEFTRWTSLAPLARTASRLEVDVDAPGHRPTTRRVSLAPVRGSELAGLDVVLEPGSTVRGRVVAVDGRPIGGAKIGWGPSGPAVSDGAGRYALAMEPGLAQRIRALADGEGIGLSPPFDVGPGPDTEAPDIVVRGPGSISGIARFLDGSPAAGVSITAWLSTEEGDMGQDFDPQDPSPAGLFRSESGTDAEGRFRIGGLAPGRYAVTDEFDPLGLEAGRYDTGATDAEVVVRMLRVRLRVEDAQGQPLPGAQYLLRWEGDGVDEETDEVSATNGTHDIWVSVGDTLHVLARVGEAFSAYRRVHVDEGPSHREVLLTVRTPAEDAGRVEVKATDAKGVPLDRFTVTLHPADPSADGFRAEGTDGAAVLPVAPGRYRVRVTAEDDLQDPGFLQPAEATVEIEPRVARPLELRLSDGGRLRIRVTGVPAPRGDLSVAVDIRPPSGTEWRPLRTFRSERGDAMSLGRLYMGTWGRNYEVIEPGTSRLRLSAPGFRSIEVPVDVRAEETVDVEVTLTP